MKACVSVPFSVLFRDTIETHGLEWTLNYCIKKLKMQQWEFLFWLKATATKG